MGFFDNIKKRNELRIINKALDLRKMMYNRAISVINLNLPKIKQASLDNLDKMDEKDRKEYQKEIDRLIKDALQVKKMVIDIIVAENCITDENDNIYSKEQLESKELPELAEMLEAIIQDIEKDLPELKK